MNRKKILLLIISIIIIIALGIGVFLLNKNNQKNHNDDSIDGVTINESIDVIKDQTIGDLKITNVSFVVIDGETSFSALVTNIGTDPVEIENLYVNFVSDNFDEKILGLSDTIIPVGANKTIRITIDSDLSATKSIKYITENND